MSECDCVCVLVTEYVCLCVSVYMCGLYVYACVCVYTTYEMLVPYRDIDYRVITYMLPNWTQICILISILKSKLCVSTHTYAHKHTH